MVKNEKIEVKEVSTVEKKILLLLESKGKCLYGNIFKELNLSQTVGAHAILSLVTKGFVKNVGVSSYYELAVDLEK